MEKYLAHEVASVSGGVDGSSALGAEFLVLIECAAVCADEGLVGNSF